MVTRVPRTVRASHRGNARLCLPLPLLHHIREGRLQQCGKDGVGCGHFVDIFSGHHSPCRHGGQDVVSVGRPSVSDGGGLCLYGACRPKPKQHPFAQNAWASPACDNDFSISCWADIVRILHKLSLGASCGRWRIMCYRLAHDGFGTKPAIILGTQTGALPRPHKHPSRQEKTREIASTSPAHRKCIGAMRDRRQGNSAQSAQSSTTSGASGTDACKEAGSGIPESRPTQEAWQSCGSTSPQDEPEASILVEMRSVVLVRARIRHAT